MDGTQVNPKRNQEGGHHEQGDHEEFRSRGSFWGEPYTQDEARQVDWFHRLPILSRVLFDR
jgi:hypothetical protein